MNISKRPVKVAILGAGISGLAAAYFLKKRQDNPPIECKVFEAKDRVGGWINTVKRGGFLFELGPHSIRLSEQDELFSLIQELGLGSELLIASPHVKSRYLYADGQLQKLPQSLLSFLLHPYTRSCVSSLLKEPFRRRGKMEAESISQFFTRRFSKEFVDKLIDPLVKGIYGGEPSLLSISDCFPDVHRLEKKYGSLILGLMAESLVKKSRKDTIYSCKQGLASVTEALQKELHADIFLSDPVQKICFQDHRVDLQSSRQYESFDYIISTLPANHLVDLFEENLGIKPLLKNISFASFAVVHFGFRNFNLPIQGFGYLVPTKENQPILGAIFDSTVFPSQNHGEEVRISVMMGGWQHPNLINEDDAALIETAQKAVSTHLGLLLEPDEVFVSKASQAIPQYFTDHQETTTAIHGKLKGLPIALLGSSFSGVSLKDCVSQSSKTVNNLLLKLQTGVKHGSR
ncbi:MAG: protoporphyrinogen oxidase [Parachlamydiaceae bacterium]